MKEYNEGKAAYNKNVALEDNPYASTTQEAINWVEGWLKADALENREYIGLGSSNSINYN